MPLPQLPGSLYISLRTCFLTKIIIIHINSSFSASFLRNAGKNSLFHTVGYIFHTVKYKSRTVKQRICKEISKNTCPELLLILPANQINPESLSYYTGSYRINQMKFPAHTPATSILLAALPRHSWPMLPFHLHRELPQSEPGLPAIHATPGCNSH